MIAETINTAAGAFVAGLATSLHCAGMCGPMACSLMSLKNDPQQQQQAAVLYHTGRLISYAVIGSLAGALGSWPLASVGTSPSIILSWFLAATLLVMAIGVPAKMPRPAWLKKWTARTRLTMARVPMRRGAFALGIITPVLPCGPLYMMFGIALLSGSAMRGAEFLLAFAFGTVPLLWFAQHRFHIWRHQLGPDKAAAIRRGLCVVGAVMVIARVWGAGEPAVAKEPGKPAAVPEVRCPLCIEAEKEKDKENRKMDHEK